MELATPIVTETAVPEPATHHAETAARTRAEINCANAAHSTGPRTAEGKLNSRQNSLKHGIYAKTAVLHTENPAEYEAFLIRLAVEYPPVTGKHLDLIKKLADSQWRLERIVATESSLFAVSIDEQGPVVDERFPGLNPDFRDSYAQAFGYRAERRLFEQLHRQEFRLRRLIDQTRAELDDLKDSQDGDNLPSKTEPVETASDPTASAAQPVASGFVPSNSSSGIPQPPAPLQSAGQPRLKMPKFSGPNGKKDRKRWLRQHAQPNAA